MQAVMSVTFWNSVEFYDRILVIVTQISLDLLFWKRKRIAGISSMQTELHELQGLSCSKYG